LLPSILCLGLLVACASSPPVRYHTLSRPETTDGTADTSGAARVLVQILPIEVPEGVARDNIVLKDPSGRVTVLQTDRWLAPVADDMKQVVADALWRAARATNTYQAPVPAQSTSLPQYRLAVRIERFDAISGQAATVEGSWTLRSLSDDAVHICRWAGTQPLDAMDGAAAAAALAEASHRLAERIGDSLRRAVAGDDEVCSGVGSSPVSEGPA